MKLSFESINAIIFNMYNWSTDIEELKKDKKKYAIWKIEQMVNFGLGGEKIKEAEFKKYWQKINADPHRLKFLKLLAKENRSRK